MTMQTELNIARGHAHVGAQTVARQLALASKSKLRASMSIEALKPNVSQSDALRKFSAAGPVGLLRNLRLGPLQRIAEVYVPFHLYRVNYNLGREPQSRLFAIDAVEGSLDLFEFPSPPTQDQLARIETRNALPTNLGDEQSQELFKLRDAHLTIEHIPLELHLAYWLAFYGRDTVRCRVLDATRNRIEGAKATALFETWLAS
jgi:hypothetical protein